MRVDAQLFPQGHAVGIAFCDRVIERKKLKVRFLNNEHTVLVAPRRYGKSSLIKQVLLDTKIPNTVIDLLPATNAFFVYRAIKTSVVSLLNELAPKTKPLRQKLLQFIQRFHPKLTLHLLGQQLEIATNQMPESSIIELLISLDTAANNLGKKVVICLDEFQQVGLLKNYHSIEAAIRHAAERSTRVTYVFSGSNRHLLSQMFHSKSRPLYHLCDLLRLDRIESTIYADILVSRVKKRWKSAVDKQVISEILSLTKCHAYYVNALCRSLWKETKKPTRLSVQKTWLDYIEMQKPWITDDLSRLSANQRNILAAIAYSEVSEPYSQEFTEKVKISASSIKKSLGVLLRDDHVYQDQTGFYRVLDPALETYLHAICHFDFLEYD